MFNPTELFKQRLKEHAKLLNRYLRYIFNGHFMIALIFIIITLSIYYQKWLEEMDESFPAAFVIALVLGVVASYNPLQMFLKEPDKVFLIVKEEEMHRYFRWTLIYNYFVQLYIVFIAAAAIVPLIGRAMPGWQTSDYLLMFVILLVVKAWNLISNWLMLKINNSQIIVMDKLIRTLLSIALFYFVLIGKFVVIIVVLYFAIIANNIYLSRKQSGLRWDALIDNDQHRLALFYRFVNMFADAPQMAKRLKKRRLLASFINRNIPFKHSATFDYLYRLSFARSSDYLNMYIRLIVLGAIVIFFVPNSWLKIVFALLFIYMANFQMVTLYYHYLTSIWLDLYPIAQAVREESFLKFLTRLTFVQTIIFAAVFLIWLDFAGALLTFAAGTVFNYLFNFGYVKRKIKK